VSTVGTRGPAGHGKRPGSSVRRTVTEVVGQQRRMRADSVVTEEPLEIRLAWPGHEAARVAVTMRTPGADFELAAGYLLAEGAARVGVPPRTVAYCVDRSLSQEQRYNVVTVHLDAPPARHPSARSTTMSSACGVCGAESLDDVFTPDRTPLEVGPLVRDDVIVSLPDLLRDRQPLFARTGSIHACGVFDFDGRLVVAREDIGRHNTVDKVLGARQLGNASYTESSILCVSGRVGFDIVTKAVAGRVAVVVAVGGPSSLAVELADRAGITLCGFTRGGRYVAYTHPERLRGV
jgi:FdhD protein